MLTFYRSDGIDQIFSFNRNRDASETGVCMVGFGKTNIAAAEAAAIDHMCFS